MVDSGRPLGRVNLACHLTLLRVSALPTLVFILLLAQEHRVAGVFIPFAAAVFLTDLLDGQVARRMHQLTQIGAYLDSTCDYVVLIGGAIAFVAVGAIPVWFFAVLMARLVIFAAGMGSLLVLQGRVDPESTFLGKAAVFASMATLAFQLCRYLEVPYLGDDTLVLGVEIACAVLLAVSAVDKALYLRRKFRDLERPRGNP